MPITPLPSVPGVLKVIVQGNTGEATPIEWQNVLHCSYTGSPPSATALGSMALVVANSWATEMAPECPSTTVENLITVMDLSSDTAAVGYETAANPGTRGDDEIPAHTACLVNYSVGLRYRGGHPRSYLLVGGNADFLDAAHWSTAFTAEVETHWRNFLASWLHSSYGSAVVGDLVAVSYYGHGGPYIPGATNPKLRVTPIVTPLVAADCTTQQEMASQRRRIGRGKR